MSKNTSKRILLLTKVKDPFHITTLQKQINKNFEDKDLYLNPNSPFHVNKLPSFDANEKQHPFSFIAPSYNNIKNTKNVHSSKLNLQFTHTRTNGSSLSQRRSYKMGTCSSMGNVFGNESSSHRKTKLEYKIVDNNILKNYYNEYKTLEHKNKSTNNEKLLLHLPKNIKKKLLDQERKLFNKKKEETRINKMSSFLCKRTRKNIKDLLIHQTDSYQFKRQAQNAIEQYKSTHGKFSGESKWIHSLRLSESNRNDNTTLMNKYVNIRTHVNPLWVVDKESNGRYHSYSKEEMKRKPRMLSNECFTNFIRRSTMRNEVARNASMKRLECLKHLEVNGKNLLKVESENESNIQGKKILYNKEQLDILTMKTVNTYDCDKEYMNMTNDKLIIKKYS